MPKNNLSTWNKKRLTGILALFFLSLCIPTAVLIQQAYSQLKWEAFHHYRLQAEELSSRIDLHYKKLIDIESARSFTDYSFLNIAGNVKKKVLQRSPLSSFPVNSKFPGIIGYFQIDHNGHFTTPLLANRTSEFYGISANEQIQRKKLHSNIHKILHKNRLLNTPILTNTNNNIQTESEEILAQDVRTSGSVGLTSMAASPKPILLRDNATKTHEKVKPQAAFDKLQEQKSSTISKKDNIVIKRRARVEDLKLKKDYQKKSLKQQQNKKSKLKRKKNSFRKESNELPIYPKKSSNRQDIKSEESLRINMFESEINEFEFSLLESGHFVLYRTVFKNGARYIQGFLIETDYFINDVIAKSFYNTNVSNASNLTIAYQGNILSTLENKSKRKTYSRFIKNKSSNTLEGSLLLQNKLSSTLENIELIFSVNNLPAGPGASVIIWLSIILIFILCGGFIALYVLGIKQLNLARQQQDFVSAVSHELKTPLTSIRMYGEMLREGWTTEEKRKQYYDYIYEESERLTRLINNVLQLAKMTRNELPVDLKPYKTSELFDIIQSKIHSQVERAQFNLLLNCEEQASEKTILSDADYFIQIFINLIDNAIKFSAKAELKKIDIHCHIIKNNKIQFTIRDYGPGINKDQMRKIFQLFYRTENELTRETVGTGIGLSLVMQLVKAMNGKVDVVNKDPGVEFQITFNIQ